MQDLPVVVLPSQESIENGPSLFNHKLDDPYDDLIDDFDPYLEYGERYQNRTAVVPPPQESMDNGPSLFNYGLDDPYNDLIYDFDPYLEYSKGYQNMTAFEDAFYK